MSGTHGKPHPFESGRPTGLGKIEGHFRDRIRDRVRGIPAWQLVSITKLLRQVVDTTRTRSSCKDPRRIFDSSCEGAWAVLVLVEGDHSCP